MALVGEGKIPPEIIRKATEQTLPLSPLESAHVFAVLKSTLEKLALVGVITVDPKVQAQELTQSVGEEITRMIAEQKELEKRFEELVSAQHMLRGLPNPSKFRENQAELQRVAEALRTSTKQLCRNLKDNPNVAENMAKVASERQSLQLLLSNTLSELEAAQRLDPIVQSVLAQEVAEIEMTETIDRERTTTSAVKQLRNDLKDEMVDHEEAMREKRKAVMVLKETLQTEKMRTAVDVRYQGKEQSAINLTQQRLHSTSTDDVRRDLQLVRQQIEIEKSVHSTMLDFMKKLTTRLQEQSVSWSSRHDEDLGSRDKDLEALKLNHQRDTFKLREMEEKWRSEMSLKQARDLLAEEERERVSAEILRHEKQVSAATRIQAAWRGFRVRNGAALEKKWAKSKQKGGKKSGKKSPAKK